MVSPLLVHDSEHFLAAGGRTGISYFPGFVTDAEMKLTPGYVHAPWHVDLAAPEIYIAAWIAGAA